MVTSISSVAITAPSLPDPLLRWKLQRKAAATTFRSLRQAQGSSYAICRAFGNGEAKAGPLGICCIGSPKEPVEYAGTLRVGNARTVVGDRQTDVAAAGGQGYHDCSAFLTITDRVVHEVLQ